MQAAERLHDTRARSQHQVKGVGDNELHAEPLELFGGHRLHGRMGPDRHERGQIDDPADERRPSAARRAVARLHREPVSAHREGTLRSSSMASP